MRIQLTLAALLAVSAATFSQDINIDHGPSLGYTANVNQAFHLVNAADYDVYNDVTNYSGSVFLNANATTISGALTTNYVADDIACTGGTGQLLSQIEWSTANLNSTAVNVRMRIRFHAMDGAGGGPGTYITGYTFALSSLAANSVQLWYFNPGVALWGTNFWAGITFDNLGGTATAAQMNNVGQGIFNPPTVGTSADGFFHTTAASVGNVSNPAGGFFNFGGSPVANFAWQFQVTPEPSTYAAIATGLIGIVGLRRRRK